MVLFLFHLKNHEKSLAESQNLKQNSNPPWLLFPKNVHQKKQSVKVSEISPWEIRGLHLTLQALQWQLTIFALTDTPQAISEMGHIKPSMGWYKFANRPHEFLKNLRGILRQLRKNLNVHRIFWHWRFNHKLVEVLGDGKMEVDYGSFHKAIQRGKISWVMI